MRFSVLLFMLCPVVFSNTLEIMDVGGLCYFYSNSTRGCTGSSEAIAMLNGTSCSNLSTIGHNKRTETNAVNVTVCGPHRQAGQELAWITADKSGLVKFQNIGGDTASCKIGKEFNVGTFCSALNVSSIETATKMPASISFTNVVETRTVASSTADSMPSKPVSTDC
ncbi:hypothetical protein N7466_001451 [Penicillium verhagenii]|uniref:uncharacterized protein n=1 Tax=Penicillium verhagenii TaxID=1562060 RepID=UPI0025456BC8|nr:uncharacterized protein N7466_001451 [Penicillium verhagenii]KAJ5938317.1 hypothetical protein N7466_001451 [Penicillium verhagenii]